MEAINGLGSSLNCEFIKPTVPNDRTIDKGTSALTSELMCLPAKVTLGSLIESCEKGATDLIMFDSCGLCRLKTYWILQQRSLNKLGYSAKIHPIRLNWKVLSDIRKISPEITYLMAAKALYRLFKQVIKTDKSLWPEIEGNNQVKIGIVGEIYTILEPAVNQQLVKTLRKMGAWVHNSLPLSYFFFKKFYDLGVIERKGIDRKTYIEAKKLAHEYFPKDIGGHGNESIIHTIYYALMGFDGVLHLFPFPCMPEATVSSILDDIGHEYHLPIMRLIFDSHTARAGLQTRLEAFVDILQRKRNSSGQVAVKQKEAKK